MATQLNIMPKSIVAGESVSLAVAINGVTPDGGWSLTYRLAASPGLSVEGVADGDGWSVNITPAQTLTFPRGLIRFDALAKKGSGADEQSLLVDSGTIAVSPSPIAESAWSAVLVQVDAAIASWGTSPNRSVSIDGMSVTFRNLDELLRLRAFCLQQVARDRGGMGPRVIRTRFNLS